MSPGSTKILVFSTLYPNHETAHHGIFVETRLRHLLQSGQIEATVLAPVPWFPFTSGLFGRVARYGRVDSYELRAGIPVYHPKYAVVPKVGMLAAPFLLAAGAFRTASMLAVRGAFEAIDAHYFYPDGVAAALLARWLHRPLVITARGTDINLIPRFRIPLALMRWAARLSEHNIAVCDALRDEMVRLAFDPHKLLTARNGVDLDLFHVQDRLQARAALGWTGARWLVSVGHLIERKGHHFVIEALANLPDCQLCIVGEGPERSRLEQLAARTGVSARVHFVGEIDQRALVTYYNAAHALVLASSREGWANVLLEAMACGTPVVATRIWGTPEVVTAPEAGILLQERTPAAIAKGVRTLIDNPPPRDATRTHAERFGWRATTDLLVDVFHRVTGVHQ